jgi:hypothetical protein
MGYINLDLPMISVEQDIDLEDDQHERHERFLDFVRYLIYQPELEMQQWPSVSSAYCTYINILVRVCTLYEILCHRDRLPIYLFICKIT